MFGKLKNSYAVVLLIYIRLKHCYEKQPVSSVQFY